MKVHNSLYNFRIKHPVISIGAFDGVHLGHQKILKHLREKAKSLESESVVLTFVPHPRIVLNPHDYTLRLLNTLKEKKMLISALNMDHLIVQEFDRTFSLMTYEAFVSEILVKKLKIKVLVIGYDNKFGHNRWGNYANLVKLSRKYGFDIEKVDALYPSAIDNISSTKIRNLLFNRGNVEKARALLGYNYSLVGKVIKGERYGRKIGFPTANLYIENPHKLIPATGVYAVMVLHKKKGYKGMLNIGFRPTISDQKHLSIEVHIFNFNKKIYDNILEIKFYYRVRAERKFQDYNALRLQLQHDRQMILKMLQDTHYSKL